MLRPEDFPAPPSSPPKAPRRVDFDNKTSCIARLQSHLNQEEEDANRFEAERSVNVSSPQLSTQAPMTPNQARIANVDIAIRNRKKTPAANQCGSAKTSSSDTVPTKNSSSKQQKPPLKSNVLADLSINQVSAIKNKAKRFASPAKDPTLIKRTDSKITPKKPADGLLDGNASPKEKANGGATPFSQASTAPHDEASPQLPMAAKEARESLGGSGKTFERDSCLMRGDSFDSAEWDAKEDEAQAQKEHEMSVLQDEWDRHREMVASGDISEEKLQFAAAWEHFNWKEEQESLEVEQIQFEMERDDWAHLRKFQLMAEENEANQLTPEEQALPDIEKREMSKRLSKEDKKKKVGEGDELCRKECEQEAHPPHKEEMNSQVAWEFQDDDQSEEGNISEPGEAKSKVDPLMFVKGHGKKPVKSKSRAMSVDRKLRGPLPEKPSSPPPPSKAVPAPVKQWTVRSGLAPEEDAKKKKKTTIKDEWSVSQEKLINSLVEELAKQQKRWLKEALKERPEAIDTLMGDDAPARRECAKTVLPEAGLKISPRGLKIIPPV